MLSSLAPDELLDEIEQQGVQKTLAHYRKNPLTVKTLQEFSNSCFSLDARLFLARCPSLPVAILNKLLKDPEPIVRSTLVHNRAVSPLHHLPILVQDAAPMVRMAVALHPKLPDAVLYELLNDVCPLVLAHTVLFAKMSDELLVHLAAVDNQLIQTLLLERKMLPEPVFQTLRESSHQAVRTALGRLRGVEPADQLVWTDSEKEEDRLFLLGLPDLSPAAQLKLAADASSLVRQKLAGYEAVDEAAAALIVQSDDVAARVALAKNASITSRILDQLCSDPQKDVLKVIAYRTDLTLHQLDVLVNDSRSLNVIQHLAWQHVWFAETSQELVGVLAGCPSASLRAFAAASRFLTNKQGDAFVRDPSPQVRLWAALNPAVSERSVRTLVADPNATIAALVRERFS